MRWVRWAGLIGLLVSALAEIRPAQATTCHALDRPTLGLHQVEMTPIPADLSPGPEARTAPVYQPVPCSDDPAVRPDHSSHLVGWFEPPAGSWVDPAEDASPDHPAAPPRFADRANRLERPPRRG